MHNQVKQVDMVIKYGMMMSNPYCVSFGCQATQKQPEAPSGKTEPNASAWANALHMAESQTTMSLNCMLQHHVT